MEKGDAKDGKGKPKQPRQVDHCCNKVINMIKVSLKTGTGREELVNILPNEYSQAGQEGALKKISE